MKKTLSERLANDILTDNTQLPPKYIQCKDCMFRKFEIDGVIIDDYSRGICAIYSLPEHKPLEFADGSASCELYEKE